MFTVSTSPEKCLNCESRYVIYHYKIELHKIYKFISSNVKSKKVDIWKENVCVSVNQVLRVFHM